MPEESALEIPMHPEQGSHRRHIHHRETLPLPTAVVGGSGHERFKYSPARQFLKGILGAQSSREKAILDTIQNTVTHEGLKQALSGLAQFSTDSFTHPEGRAEASERARYLRELIAGGEVTGRDREMASRARSWYDRHLARSREATRTGAGIDGTDDVRRMREAVEATARATKKTAASTEAERRAQTLKEINQHPLGAYGWLRNKLNDIEARSSNFESYGNRVEIEQIYSVLNNPSFGEAIRRQYLAERSLNDYFLTFATAGELEELKGASLITNETLQVILRTPGVGQAFREYEKRARQEREIYNKIKNGTLETINTEEKLTTATGAHELSIVRQSIRKSLQRTIRNTLVSKFGEEVVAQIDINEHTSAAQRLGEWVWQITGRSSYWNAFTSSGSPEGEREKFKTAQGKDLGGSFLFTRLYNFREYLKISKVGILSWWLKDQQNLSGKEVNLLDLRIFDYWTSILGKLRGGKTSQAELSNLGLQQNDIESIDEDERGFLGSLENLPVEHINLTSLTPGSYIMFIVNTSKADKARSTLNDFESVLSRNPDEQNFVEQLSKLFDYLSPKERSDMIGNILWGIIELSQPRGILRRPLMRTEYGRRDWQALTPMQIEAMVRRIESAGLINHTTSERILQKKAGPKLVRMGRRTVPVAENIRDSVLESLVEAVEAAIGK